MRFTSQLCVLWTEILNYLYTMSEIKELRQEGKSILFSLTVRRHLDITEMGWQYFDFLHQIKEMALFFLKNNNKCSTE